MDGVGDILGARRQRRRGPLSTGASLTAASEKLWLAGVLPPLPSMTV